MWSQLVSDINNWMKQSRDCVVKNPIKKFSHRKWSVVFAMMQNFCSATWNFGWVICRLGLRYNIENAQRIFKKLKKTQIFKFNWQGSESVRLLARQAENSTSGWGSFWERSPLGSWFSMSAFRNVPGKVPENLRICGFKRKSSYLDSAPKMRDSVLLNSWDSYLVTLPSISWETWAIKSSVIPGAAEFFDRLFLGHSCVSFAIAANFLLFLNVAIILEEGKISTVVKIELFVSRSNFNTTETFLLINKSRFPINKLIKLKSTQNSTVQYFVIIIVLSFLLFIPFPWRET